MALIPNFHKAIVVQMSGVEKIKEKIRDLNSKIVKDS